MLWGWLRSYAPDHNGQKGELLPIEEIGRLLHGKQVGNHEMSDHADASSVPVSLKTQGSYLDCLVSFALLSNRKLHLVNP